MTAQQVFVEEMAKTFFPDRIKKVAWFDPEKCDDNQNSINHTDTRKVLKWPEVRDPLMSRRVINPDRDRQDINAAPCSPYEHLYLKFIFPTEKSKRLQCLERIEAIAGLSVGQLDTCLHLKPKIGKLISEIAFAGDTILVHISGPDHDGIFMLLQRLYHHRQVISEMLSVCIYGDSIVIAIGKSKFKSFSQGPPFADISGVGE